MAAPLLNPTKRLTPLVSFKFVRPCSSVISDSITENETPQDDDQGKKALSTRVEDTTLRYDVDTIFGKGRITPRYIDVETSIKYMESEGMSPTFRFSESFSSYI